ncbi:outer membrane protein assembly factor BamA [Chelatococcus sp. SYSU_G07232]|uniref:Outer membrane protein assembly factor BamA n=2 Tax=Chelatococcus albus TaxID=3047466 RepID=A0ABT7ADT5_9HYPH|nr:outer membrane protein assembly factor BamA [Chelatococcus sp. SYSU_G07232]MDJ1156776.1 outer membrane protein assembly factor BamA [Chelatococcus sp. SYSU_G07232]
MLLATVAMVAGADMAYAQAVVVQGNRRVEAETIRSYLTGRGAGSVEEARRELLATGMFRDVRINRRGSTTVVTVVENELINRVVFEGNKKINKDVLLGEVQSKARGAFSQATVNADIERIKDVYRRSGRGLATVTARTVDLPNGRVDVVFTIDEGEKTGVKAINFVGNHAFSASKLRGLMTTTEMNFLSWLKTSDVYDPDRINADLELIRRYYLKNGYADFRVVSSDAVFDAAQGGYIVTITVDEGEQYRVGDVRVESQIADIDSAQIQGRVKTAAGDVYSAEAVEKSLQAITTETGKRGYAFAQVRPVGQRDPASRTINIAYVVEEGPRVYIERINVRGNTRSRDYVVRREFDIGEGDPYNKVLIDRAERRLNNLGYFKKVRITNEPGSTPDRVIVNVDVEDQSTGQFSISGGYSTADGFIGEVAVSESNFLGRGQYVRVAGSWGQRAQGVDFSFTEPYFLGQRMAFGVDLFSKYTDNTNYARYENRVTGGQLRLGLPITEEFTVTWRYSLYQSNLKVPNTASKPYNDCSVPISGVTPLNPNGSAMYPNCTYNGEASVAIKEARGDTLTSLVGATLNYNTLDNIRDPRSGFFAEVKPEVAGLGGDSRFIRATAEARYYHEIWDDIVGMLKVQGGHIAGFGGRDLRIVDNFFLGPSLVRGFAPSGIGPRDLNGGDARSNALGGTTYFGATAEVQFPIFGLPRELGLRGALFADAGTLYGYKGKRAFDLNGNGSFNCPGNAGFNPSAEPECINLKDDKTIRSSVGASLLWSSPLGPIRFDYAFALSKADGDRTQAFRFSGGTRF